MPALLMQHIHLSVATLIKAPRKRLGSVGTRLKLHQ
jgi:hypothetical protein